MCPFSVLGNDTLAPASLSVAASWSSWAFCGVSVRQGGRRCHAISVGRLSVGPAEARTGSTFPWLVAGS